MRVERIHDVIDERPAGGAAHRERHERVRDAVRDDDVGPRAAEHGAELPPVSEEPREPGERREADHPRPDETDA